MPQLVIVNKRSMSERRQIAAKGVSHGRPCTADDVPPFEAVGLCDGVWRTMGYGLTVEQACEAAFRLGGTSHGVE